MLKRRGKLRSYIWGLRWFKEGKYRNAVKIFEQMISDELRDEENGILLFNIGVCYQYLDVPYHAVQSYQRCLDRCIKLRKKVIDNLKCNKQFCFKKLLNKLQPKQYKIQYNSDRNKLTKKIQFQNHQQHTNSNQLSLYQHHLKISLNTSHSLHHTKKSNSNFSDPPQITQLVKSTTVQSNQSTQYLNAYKYYKQRNFFKSLTHLKNQSKTGYISKQCTILVSKILCKQQQYKKSTIFLQKNIEQDNVEMYYRLGWTQCKAGCFSNGIVNIQKALSLRVQAKHLSKYMEIALYVRDSKLLNQAIRLSLIYLSSFKNTKYYKRLIFLQAGLHYETQNYDQMKRIIQSHISSYSYLNYWLGKYYFKFGQPKQSAQCLTSFLTHVPNDKDASIIYALLIKATYNLNSYITFLQKIRVIHPQDQTILYHLVKQAQQKNDLKSLLKYGLQLININQDLNLTIHIIKKLMSKKNHRKGLIILDSLQFVPSTVKIYLKAMLYYYSSRLGKAVYQLQILTKLGKISKQMRYIKAQCHYKLGQYQNAKRDILHVPQSQRGNMLACCYANLNNFIKADKQFRKLLNANPNDPTILFNLGCLYARNNNPSSALLFFRKAIQINPQFSIAQYNLHVVLRLCGQQQYKQHLQRAIQINKKDEWLNIKNIQSDVIE